VKCRTALTRAVDLIYLCLCMGGCVNMLAFALKCLGVSRTGMAVKSNRRIAPFLPPSLPTTYHQSLLPHPGVHKASLTHTHSAQPQVSRRSAAGHTYHNQKDAILQKNSGIQKPCPSISREQARPFYPICTPPQRFKKK
jgi:hypothetical protein